jgi:UDP-N-acetylglucosamine 2-epimerase (non-hydrolysing)
MVVYGTRPEAIKLAPLIGELQRSRGFRVRVAVTGQHREMLDQVNEVFDIVPAHDLDIIQPRQSLEQVTCAALTGLTELVRVERPDAVLIQGDTTTAFAGALAGFYEHVPVVHLEAGLRTGHWDTPFPEEMNRRLVTQLTRLHLAPTRGARAHLLREGVDPATVVVTGNTVVDALLWTVGRRLPYTDPYLSVFLERHPRTVLVTAHRRESWGAPMAAIARALATIARTHPDVGIVLPAHLNPTVRETLLPPLRSLPNVLVTDPLPYGEFCHLMSDCSVILTDSGGVQEEAPSLGKPLLVMRESTERPEGVVAGAARLVGTYETAIVDGVQQELRGLDGGPRVSRQNPYGDGAASKRAAAAIGAMLGMGERLPDFEPGE